MRSHSIPCIPAKARTKMRATIRATGWVLLTLALLPMAAAGATRGMAKNGFALEPSAIAAGEILAGGPPRDGIIALSNPKTQSAASAVWPDNERVVGVVVADRARAYPLSLLVWHELVNDELAGEPILVSYCPLCGTALVFDRRVRDEVLSFGVSGLLYRSNLLMYDRQSESLWSQISAEAVTGRRMHQRLRSLRSRIVRWGRWKAEHPDSDVLSPETGYPRPYGRSPYGDYARSRELLFPIERDTRYHPKAATLGLRLAGGVARAYPAVEVAAAGGCVRERLGERLVEVRWDEVANRLTAEAPPGVEVIEGYWFAWAAFHPNSSVFVAASPAAADARCK